MLVSAGTLLLSAQKQTYAIGAFNVYNLEGVRAVVRAAESEQSPVILQIHPAAFHYGSIALVELCLNMARGVDVPVGVHFDHSDSSNDIDIALKAGIASIMADGSGLSYEENVSFTRQMAEAAHAKGAVIEAELGKLAGNEDKLTVEEYEAKLTDPEQAGDFVRKTGVDSLAVCIGNVHGKYSSEPRLDFARLQTIRKAVSIPLVLHGASGLPEAMVRLAIELGVTKLNVNTEVRGAFVGALRERFDSPGKGPDLLELMERATTAMQEVVRAKLRLFNSSGKA